MPTPTKRPYRPRIVIECTEEQKRTLHNYIESGMQNRVLRIVLDDVVKLLDEFGITFVMYIMERRFSYRPQVAEYANSRPANSALESVK